MNWSVLKDLKTMLGFIISILLGLIAVILAVNSNSYWVVFVVGSVIPIALIVIRADKIYKNKIVS